MYFNEFVGGAILPDIAHHVYGGDIAHLLIPGKSVWRVLFAEHFNEKMIYALIGSVTRPAQQSIVVDLDITVVTANKELVEDVRLRMSKCDVPGVEISLKFEDGTLNDLMKYSSDTMEKYTSKCKEE